MNYGICDVAYPRDVHEVLQSANMIAILCNILRRYCWPLRLDSGSLEGESCKETFGTSSKLLSVAVITGIS